MPKEEDQGRILGHNEPFAVAAGITAQYLTLRREKANLPIVNALLFLLDRLSGSDRNEVEQHIAALRQLREEGLAAVEELNQMEAKYLSK